MKTRTAPLVPRGNHETRGSNAGSAMDSTHAASREDHRVVVALVIAAQFAIALDVGDAPGHEPCSVTICSRESHEHGVPLRFVHANLTSTIYARHSQIMQLLPMCQCAALLPDRNALGDIRAHCMTRITSILAVFISQQILDDSVKHRHGQSRWISSHEFLIRTSGSVV